MPRVIHFEIPADEPERAVKFYRDVFGWTTQKIGGPMDYWLAGTGPDDEPGINGAITRRGDRSCLVNTIDVPSFEESVKKIEAAGGKVLMPKMAVTGVGYMTYAVDTEGNTFGIMEMDAAAA